MLNCILRLEGFDYPLQLPANEWAPAKGQSRAFYCPFCPGLWGTLQIEDYKYFSCREMSCGPCRRFTGSCMVPGSLTDALWPGCLDYLPAPLLRREFCLHDFTRKLIDELTSSRADLYAHAPIVYQSF